MKVRLFQAEDNPVLARLVTETVQNINAVDYSPAQVKAWAGKPPDVERWCGQRADRVAFVAEYVSEISGFATFEADGHLDHLYVHHRFQRQGIASALLRRIEQEAGLLGVGRIFTEASISARPFFEQRGFQLIAPQTISFNGILFLNYRMEKFLA